MVEVLARDYVGSQESRGTSPTRQEVYWRVTQEGGEKYQCYEILSKSKAEDSCCNHS